MSDGPQPSLALQQLADVSPASRVIREVMRGIYVQGHDRSASCFEVSVLDITLPLELLQSPGARCPLSWQTAEQAALPHVRLSAHLRLTQILAAVHPASEGIPPQRASQKHMQRQRRRPCFACTGSQLAMETLPQTSAAQQPWWHDQSRTLADLKPGPHVSASQL